MSEWSWSSYQNDIYDFLATSNQSLTVKAMAGSGKTKSLVEAATRIRGAGGHSVLFCAFNTSIRDEIQQRVPPSIEVKTIHQLGMRSLVGGPRKLKVEDKKYMGFIDNVGLSLGRNVFGRKNPTPEQYTRASDCLSRLIDFGRNHLVGSGSTEELAQCADQFGIDDFDIAPEVFSNYFGQAVEWGISKFYKEGLIDFNDMVCLPHYLDIQMAPADTVFVDECQDLSKSRAGVVKRIARVRAVTVGDPRQAIYGFAGADHRSYDNLRESLGAAELPLSICYRCPPVVIDIAHQFVPEIESFDGHPGGTVTNVSYVEALAEMEIGDMVLSRTNANAISTCLSLLSMRKPACVKGQDVCKRILSLVKDAMRTAPWSLFEEVVMDVAEQRATHLRKKDREAAAQSILDTAASAIAARRGLGSYDYQSFETGLRGLFAEGRKITISTIHKAKGLEALRVFVLAWDRLPLRWRNQKDHEAEQERNLCYVAVTRSLRDLFLVASPQR